MDRPARRRPSGRRAVPPRRQEIKALLDDPLGNMPSASTSPSREIFALQELGIEVRAATVMLDGGECKSMDESCCSTSPPRWSTAATRRSSRRSSRGPSARYEIVALANKVLHEMGSDDVDGHQRGRGER